MKKATIFSLSQPEEHYGLRAEIDRTRYRIESVCNHFDEALDPTMIDCCIYELKAAQLRYQYLLRRFKSLEELME
jgi:hypothetical protein